MNRNMDEIVDNFARWAAMSSARQGCSLRGKKWYKHMNNLNFDRIMDTSKGPITSSEFDEWHKETVERLAKEAKVEIGWAAKIVNMILKVKVYIHGEGRNGLKEYIHPVIDNKLIDELKKKYPLKSGNDKTRKIRYWLDKAKPISGIKSYGEYEKIIECFRQISKDYKMSLFEVEKFWRP